MRLVVLGSGTTVPHATRSPSGYWVQTSTGSILLDCSATVPFRMAQERLDWPALDSIWISHFHIDHCGGLAPFLAGTKHTDEMKGRKKPLKIFGPVGLRRLLDAFDQANNYRLFSQPFPVETIEIDELEAFEILPQVEAVALKTPHTDESHAIHIRDSSGKTLVFTADTGFSESLADFFNGVDLAVVECSFLKEKPVEKHLELAEAIYLVRKARPRRVVLTHLYPLWDDIDIVAEAAKFSPPCEIIEARDGLRVTI